MANLISALAVAGCRKSDGTANASGYVFLYSPGTTTLVLGYKDDALTQPWTTVGGGIPLDAGGRATIWVAGRVDVIITDASGTQVSAMLGFNGTTANAVQVQNAGYTGSSTDPATGNVTQGAGGLTDLDTLLTRATSSFGGLDFQYLESTGGTPRKYADVIRSIQVTPEDFGAVGNNIADDTQAVLAALNEMKRLAGGTLYLAKIYKVSQALALTSVPGLRIAGAGAGVSGLNCVTDAITPLALTTCNSLVLENFSVTRATGASTGGTIGLKISGGTGVSCSGVVVSGFDIAAQESANQISWRDCRLTGESAATSRGLNVTAGAGRVVLGGSYGVLASGVAMNFTGAASNTAVIGANFLQSSQTGVQFDSSFTGSRFAVIGCPSLGVLPGVLSNPLSVAVATDPRLTWFGNDYDDLSSTFATGTTQTPSRLVGSVTLKAGSGGAGAVTVNAPTPAPVGGANGMRNKKLVMHFVNAAGGAVTWTMNAVYKLSAAIPTTDGHSITVGFFWDSDNSVWREEYRTDTTT